MSPPFDPAWAAPRGPADYCDAVWAAALLAVDPGLGGVCVRAWSGPSRDNFLAGLFALFPAGEKIRKMPLGIGDDRLLGGIDIPATLQAGRPVRCAGLLEEAAGGILVLAMAERISAGTASRVAAAVDGGGGFVMVALDEGVADEVPPAVLPERLAFSVSGLPGADELWPAREEVQAARERFALVTADEKTLTQICGLAAGFGIGSLRAPLFALRAARAAAALGGRERVGPADMALAVRLVLAPRATQMPAAPDETPAEEPEQEQEQQASEPEQRNQEPLEDSVADATQAVLPPELLAALAAGIGQRRARGAGKSGETLSLKRGRPAAARPGALAGDARLSLIDTLRAAAPWQKLRRNFGRRIAIRADDFRIRQFREQARTIAIFAVDASGSSAVNRLSEAKGAIQLLLADCYVRRDQVALLAFRGRAAECLLPPTHALARAKRQLAGLPGGGPTPLATGINAARALAESERRKGHKPLLVLLTDGGANIGRDGKPGRAAAAADALAAGQACRAANIAALVVDTAPRPQAFVARLAADMGGRYLPLPYADAGRLTRAVREAA